MSKAAAMEASVSAEVQKVLESSREPCTKKEKIVSTLVGAGLPYRRREPIIAILMHPKNRAGSWCSRTTRKIGAQPFRLMELYKLKEHQTQLESAQWTTLLP